MLHQLAHAVMICLQNMCVYLQEVRLYLDYKADESYTPSKLSIRAGSAYHDLKVRQQLQQLKWQGGLQACCL
jgi:hypothetical protein